MNPSPAKTRLTQELALLSALRDKTLAGLREQREHAESLARGATEFLEAARPHLERWSEAGFPEDAKLVKLARRYLKALAIRQDAAQAVALVGQVLEEHGEQAPLQKAYVKPHVSHSSQGKLFQVAGHHDKRPPAKKESKQPTGHAAKVAQNMQHLGTTLDQWEAVPITGMHLAEGPDGKQREVPQFGFEPGYNPAPTLYPNSGGEGDAHCELCGHKIRDFYWIRHPEKKWTMGVGSECIQQFGEGKSGKQLAAEVARDQKAEADAQIVLAVRDLARQVLDVAWKKRDDAAFDRASRTRGLVDPKSKRGIRLAGYDDALKPRETPHAEAATGKKVAAHIAKHDLPEFVRWATAYLGAAEEPPI